MGRRRETICVIAGALILAGCGKPSPADANVEVEDAWVRLPAVPGRPAAAYFHIRTDVGPATLVRVDSPLAQRAEMHASMAGGMRPLARVTIPADDAATFAPGDRHVMLFGVAPKVKAGGTMPLRLTFAGDPVPALIEAKVVGPADAAP